VPFDRDPLLPPIQRAARYQLIFCHQLRPNLKFTAVNYRADFLLAQIETNLKIPYGIPFLSHLAFARLGKEQFHYQLLPE
jgi:hypothetical protein